MTRNDYIALFANLNDAIEHENNVLSAGSEFLPICAIIVRDGGAATAEYYAFLASQIEGSDISAQLDRAHKIGRECCEYWMGYRDQPGTPADPSEWELSDLDRATTLQELCIELDAPHVQAVYASLEAGFSERRAELAEAFEMVHDDIRAWRSEGLLDGIIARHRAGQPVECEWHSSDIVCDDAAVRSAYCVFLAEAF